MLERAEWEHAELLHICSNVINFANYIRTLSETEYDILFSRLGYQQSVTCLHDGVVLSKILKGLPETKRAALLFAIGPDILKAIIHNRAQLGEILKVLHVDDYAHLYDLLAHDFQAGIITDAQSLAYILRMLPKENYAAWLHSMASVVERVLTNQQELLTVLNLLHGSQQIALLDALSSLMLQRCISDMAQFHEIFNRFPEEKMIAWMDKYLFTRSAQGLQSVVGDMHELAYALSYCSEMRRPELLDRLGKEYLHAILLSRSTVKELMATMEEYATRDKQVYRYLIVAAIRAYHHDRASVADAHLHWYGALFRAPDRQNKLTEAENLEAAVAQDDDAYFQNLTDKQRRIVEHDRLGIITSAYTARR